MTSASSAHSKGLSAAFRKIAFAATVLLIMFILGALLNRQFDEAQELGNQTNLSYERRTKVRILLLALHDLEANQQAYVATGQPEYMIRFRQARDTIGPSIGQLERELGRSPVSDPEIRRLHRLITDEIRLADRVVALRQSGAEEAAENLGSAEGMAIRDASRLILGHMIAIEDAKVKATTAQGVATDQQVRYLAYALQALLLLLLGTAGWVASRNLKERHAAMQRFADLSARQEAIFDAATDGMITHDIDGYIENLNPSAARLYGYRREDLIGQHIDILFETPPDRKLLKAYLARLARNFETEGAPIQEFGALCSDGKTFVVDVATSPVTLADGMCFVAVIRDVTEQRRIERMKDEFVSTVSHELRTPLTSIAGSLGLLAGGAGGEIPERAAKLIRIAQSNSERLVRLVNDILNIEKLESGTMTFKSKAVALRPLLEQAIEANQGFATEYGVTYRLEPGGDEAVVFADPDRLNQIATNLLSNAAKFSSAGGEVVVRIVPGERMHRFTVEDKGAGIPPEFRSRVFARFAQADASDTRKKGGTGLGLSIVKEIATRLKGDVSFDTEEGKGSAFHVDLPAYRKS